MAELPQKPNTEEKIAEWRKEIVEFLTEMAKWSTEADDPLYIMKRLSSCTARASWMRNKLIRSGARNAKAFLAGEIDPFIDECDRQFRIWSRVGALMRDEFDMTR